MAERSFLSELKHRKVYRAAAIYAGAAFVVWQVADIALPTLGAPEWVMRLLVIGAIAGFPVVLALAWLVELAPAGARRLRFAVTALVGLALLGGAAAVVARVGLPEPEPDLSERTLAVLPFHVRGSEGLQYLRDGLVELLSRNLGGPDLHPVDPSAVMKAAEREGDEALSASSAAEVARRVGAGQYVLGTVNQAGGRLRIHATLYELRDSVHAIATGEADGDTLQLFEMVDRLTAELLTGRPTGEASRRVVRTAATTTSSLPALKLYLDGERHFRVAQHDSAIARFGEALEQDSTFALARFRRAISHALNGDPAAARREVERLQRESSRLSEHDRRVLNAFAAHMAGRVGEAERLYRAVVREHPADVEAKVMLASLITTYAPLRGTARAEAKPLLADVERLDPEFLCIACMQIAVAHEERNYDRAAEVIHRLDGAQGRDTTHAFQREWLKALRSGDSTRVAREIALADSLLEHAELRNTQAGMFYWAMLLGHFDAARRVLEASPDTGAAERPLLFRRAHLAMGTGKLRDAEAAIARLARHATPLPARIHAGLAIGHAPLQLGSLDELRERLLRWEPPLESETGEPDSVRRSPRFFFLGLVDARRGDAHAGQWADSLDRVLRTTSGLDSVLVAGMSHTLRGDIAWRAGEPQEALRWLEQVSPEVPFGLFDGAVDHVYYGADLRAYVSVDAGEFEEALRWLRHAPDGLSPDYNYGDWHLAMARALDGLGRRDEAAAHYERVLEAWSDADPELRPQVEYARRRLTAIRIE